MRNRRSLHTVSSSDIRSEWQMSTMGNPEEELYQDNLWTPYLTFDPFQAFNSYSDTFLYDYNAGGDAASQNLYPLNADDFQTTTEDTYEPYDDTTTTYVDSVNPTEYFCFPPGPLVDESQSLPAGIGIPCYNAIPFQPPVLQCGYPVVSGFGAVSLLLRHLVRIDLTPSGSVSVYNFPAMSVTTLSASGNKCFVKHPNGRVFQEDSVVHMMIENNRFVRIDRKGIIFSSTQCSLAYVVDESGTKTTTGRFVDLSNDLTTNVFYDCNFGYNSNLEQQCYQILSEASYQVCPDGSEMWQLGKIRIKQDKWGEVTVVQNDSNTSIGTSPTIRRVNISSPSMSINIDCFSKNYLTVRKDTHLVTSGCCGLFVQSRSQKAGLDRTGKLVLF